MSAQQCEDFEELAYGFRWGAAKVERLASVRAGAGHHVIMRISTPRGFIDVRVTPSGMIRTEQGKR